MATPLLGLQPLGTILTSDEPAVDWVVEGMIAREGVTFLVARPGAGKSLLAGHIGACVVTGTPLFDELTVTQGAVAYLDLDMHRARLTGMRVAAALRGIGTGDAAIATAPYYIAAQQSSVDLRELDTLEQVMSELATIPNLAVVVLDSFSDLHHGKEQSSDDMTDTVSGAVAIATRLKCGVLVNHHARKGGNTELEDVRGASSIVAKADAVFILKTERDDDDNPGKLTLLQRKSRLTEEARPRHLTLETNGDLNGKLDSYSFMSGENKGGRPPVATAEAEKIVTRLLWEQPDMPKPALVKKLIEVGISKNTAYRVAGIRFSQKSSNPTPGTLLGNPKTLTTTGGVANPTPVGEMGNGNFSPAEYDALDAAIAAMPDGGTADA